MFKWATFREILFPSCISSLSTLDFRLYKSAFLATFGVSIPFTCFATDFVA